MAVTPPLMSERNEPYAPGWRDCMYASALMAVYKHGKHSFALGYDQDEREAFERSDDRPNETGANVGDIDVATQRRYGFTLAKVPDLHAALAGSATTGLVVAGNMHLMPSWQKRWDPTFGAKAYAAHAVYAQPMGDHLHVRWMDPLATWGFGGDVIDLGLVIRFNSGVAGTVAQTRLAKEPAAPPPPPAGVVLKYGGYAGFRGQWRVTGDHSRFRSKPYLSAPIIQEVNAGYQFSNAQTTDKGSVVNGSGRWLGDATGNRWMHISLVTPVR